MKNGQSNRASPLDPEFAALIEQLAEPSVAPIDSGLAQLVARISNPAYRRDAHRAR